MYQILTRLIGLSLLIPGFFTLVNAQDKTKPARVKVSISGKVTDLHTGENLPGASIYLADDKIGAFADQNGYYQINNIPPGHHVIEVSHTGYATLVEHLELGADIKKDFQLSTVIAEHQGVIVTGVSGATSIRNSPVPVNTVRKSDLLQTTASNIVDALTHVPGVSQLSSGPAVSKPFIRGLGYNRVVTVNEGVRQEGQQWGDEHGLEIDELSVGKVEIVKGPASLMYGSDAIAGVINFITNTPVSEGTVKGNLLGHYQSNNGLYALNGNIAGNEHGFNWNIYATYKSAGDYKNKYDGRVLNSRFNEKNFGGYAGINKSWGYSHLLFSRFNQRLGVIEGDREASTGSFLLFPGSARERIATKADLESRELFVPNQWVKHHKLVSDNNLAFKKSRLKINLAYQQNLRQEYGDPEFPSEQELIFDLRTFNYNFQWQLPEKKEWHTTIGITGMQQEKRNKGKEVLIPEYKMFDAGVFLFAQRIFQKSTFSGGIRFDTRNVNSEEYYDGANLKFSSFKRRFSNVSGSAGISMEPSKSVTVKINLARGFRAPTIAELASNGAHEGTNRYEYGEEQLRSETSLQLDGGIDINTEHFTFGLSGFYNRMNDFIFYRKLESNSGGDSLVNVGGDFIPAFRFDQQHAKLVGFEATFDFHPHPLDWLHVENTISFVRGKFDEAIEGTRNLPLIPAASLISELRADFKQAGKSLRNLYVKLEADKTFAQKNPFTAYQTETRTSGYTLVHAGMGTDVTGKNKRIIFSLHLSMNNIFDEAWQSHLSRLKYTAVNNLTGRQGVFNSGRNFSLKLNFPLTFKAVNKMGE